MDASHNSDINANILTIQRKIHEVALQSGRSPEDIRLVAVSKRHPVDAIKQAALAGHTIFGENYIQEAEEKKEQIPDHCALHFIGHLQSNKVKIAARIFDMVETVDRLKVARALNTQLEKLNKHLDILIQVNIGDDPNKSGVSVESAEALIREIKEFSQLRIKGLMTMPPITPDPEKARPHFKNLKALADKLAEKDLFTNPDKIELSMGMSHDFHIAIEEGATLVRVGTAIFGERPPLMR